MASEKPISPEFAEIDPTGRYGRYDEVLGKGASKTVYRAFDEYEGIEVAWNQVRLQEFLQSPEGLERLYSEIYLLRTLDHKNIMRFYTSWVDPSRGNINFVTEMFASGTLRQYRQKHRKVSMRAVKRWCRQILEGLHYLHSHDPPIIHRDLKCDNIFVNGNQGEVKIGDLGLAAILLTSPAARCVGTPEFMAPEVYEEQYNELVDIYSFGMCVLEMVTLEYPYTECNNPVEIYKRVASGMKPEALLKVQDPEVREFVEKCLVPMSQRLSACELLKDPFLNDDENINPNHKEDFESDLDPLQMRSLSIHASSGHLMANVLNGKISLEIENHSGYDNFEDIQTNGKFSSSLEDGKSPEVDIAVDGRRIDDGRILLKLRISEKDRARNIYFYFNVDVDTALTVATEMVGQLEYLTDFDVTYIAEMIDGELLSLMPDWRPGPGFEDTPGHSTPSDHGDCTSTIPLHMCISDYVHLDKLNYMSLPSPWHMNNGDVDGQLADESYFLDNIERSFHGLPSLIAAHLDGSFASSPHQEDNMNSNIIAGSGKSSRLSSFRKNGMAFFQNQSKTIKGRFLCGSFRKVSLDLSEEASVHVRSKQLEECGTEKQKEVRWRKPKYKMKPKKCQIGHVKKRSVVSTPLAFVSNQVVNSAGENAGPSISKGMPASNGLESSSSNRSKRDEAVGDIGSQPQSLANEDSRLRRSCEAGNERKALRFFTARRFFMAFLHPHGCLPCLKSYNAGGISRQHTPQAPQSLTE